MYVGNPLLLLLLILLFLFTITITITIAADLFTFKSKLSCSTEEGIDYLEQLKSSSFGRFLLKNKGLNGFWTQYVCLWPYAV